MWPIVFGDRVICLIETMLLTVTPACAGKSVRPHAGSCSCRLTLKTILLLLLSVFGFVFELKPFVVEERLGIEININRRT